MDDLTTALDAYELVAPDRIIELKPDRTWRIDQDSG